MSVIAPEPAAPGRDLTPPTAPPVVDPALRAARRRQTFRDIIEAPAGRIVVQPRVSSRRRPPWVDVAEFGSAPVDAVVATLYRSILGREPDANGLASWSEHLLGGTPIDDLARALAASDEAVSATPEQQARATRVLQRIGLVRTLEDLGAYPEAVFTPGRPGLAADQIFVSSLYEVALRRRPTPEELELEVGKLERGVSREWMLRAFANRRDVRRRLIGLPGRHPRNVARYALHSVGYLRTFRDLVNGAESRRITTLANVLSNRVDEPGRNDGRTA